MNNSILSIAYFTTIMLLSSCVEQKYADTNTDNSSTNQPKFESNNNERDSKFLVEAAQINLEEIQLGRLAMQNGHEKHVKDLGEMMVDAHTESHRNLVALARSISIEIPTTTTNNAKNAYARLDQNSGKDFDKAYTDMLVSGHKDAISTYEKASEFSDDIEVQKFATSTLRDMRKHLDHAMESQKKCDNYKSK